MAKTSTLYNLADYIDTILNGTAEEKLPLSMRYYEIAESEALIKSLGIKGEKFTIRYGVITRHKNKDAAHNLTATEWKELCEKINQPLFVTSDGKSFTLFLDICREGKVMLVGVTVRQTGKTQFVNAVDTVFFTNHFTRGGKMIYVKQKITVAQQALLNGLNSVNIKLYRAT